MTRHTILFCLHVAYAGKSIVLLNELAKSSTLNTWVCVILTDTPPSMNDLLIISTKCYVLFTNRSINPVWQSYEDCSSILVLFVHGPTKITNSILFQIKSQPKKKLWDIREKIRGIKFLSIQDFRRKARLVCLCVSFMWWGWFITLIFNIRNLVLCLCMVQNWTLLKSIHILYFTILYYQTTRKLPKIIVARFQPKNNMFHHLQNILAWVASIFFLLYKKNNNNSNNIGIFGIILLRWLQIWQWFLTQ